MGVSTHRAAAGDDLVWEPLMDVTTVDTLALEGATAKEKDLSVQTYGLSGESKTLMLVTSDSLSNDALITQLEARRMSFSQRRTTTPLWMRILGEVCGRDVAGFSSTGTSHYSKYQWQFKNTGLVANGNKGYDVETRATPKETPQHQPL